MALTKLGPNLAHTQSLARRSQRGQKGRRWAANRHLSSRVVLLDKSWTLAAHELHTSCTRAAHKLDTGAS